MRRLIILFSIIGAVQYMFAQGGGGSGPVCRVNVISNEVGLPDDAKDGLLLLRVFVSSSTSCRGGEVEVAVFPDSVCRKRPKTDLDDSKPMTFVYKPPVLKIALEPGSLNSGVVEISSGDVGTCTFNSHLADCGSVVPPGGRCETRDLTDPRSELEHRGGVEREFNRLR